MAELGGVSGLQPSPLDASMLHQPHQPRGDAGPGDRYSLFLNFDSNAAFGKSNRIFLPPLEMVVDDIWIEFQLGAVSGPADPSLAQVQTWLNSSGAQILYRSQSVYQMSEAEAVAYGYLNPDNQLQLTRLLEATNDISVARRRTKGGAANIYYMSLKPLADKVMSKMGSLSAYAANSWSFDIGLLPLTQVIEGSNGTAGAVTLSSMRLIIGGHREDPSNAMRVSEALASGGVKVIFEQSNWARQTYSAAAASAVVSLPELEGEATDVVVLQRVTAGLVGVAPNTVNHLNWNIVSGGYADAAGDTIAVGTSSNPTKVFGVAIPQRTVRMATQGSSLNGAAVFVDSDGALRETTIMPISLCEKSSLGQFYGTYSGSLRLKNDFRITLSFASTVVASTIDTIVYIRRVMILKHDGLVMLNEE